MIQIEDKKLKEIKGGLNISAALVKAVLSTFNTILDAGRHFGSSIRRLFSNKMCELK